MEEDADEGDGEGEGPTGEGEGPTVVPSASTSVRPSLGISSIPSSKSIARGLEKGGLCSFDRPFILVIMERNGLLPQVCVSASYWGVDGEMK